MITLINHQGLKVVKGIQIQTPAPPIGIAYIGAFLKKHGYSYTAIDACGEALDQKLPYDNDKQIMIQGLTTPQILQRVPKGTKIFGFTWPFSHCWSLVEKMVSAIRKENPNAIFVTGGEHPTAMPEHVLKTGLFDVVVMGEGEETFLEIVRKIEANEPWDGIDGITYLDKEGKFVKNKPRKRIQDINNFPYPDWDSWCIEEYIKYRQVAGINLGRSMPILGSRGCPYACTFCSNKNMWTRRYIMRDGRSIVDEMEYMENKYGVTGFTFMDSTFVINRNKTLDFCKELIRRNLNISYQLPAGTRCEAFDEELIFALERSGLRNFAFAPESGSEMIRKVIKKQIKMDMLFEAIKTTKKTKMTVGCYIVIGFPEDTEQTMRETLSLVRKLALIGVDDLNVAQFTPYPGSPLFDELLKKKKISDNLDELNNLISFFSKDNSNSYSESINFKQLHNWMLWMFINFYVISFTIRPWRLVRNFLTYFLKNKENARYMRFFSEFFRLRRKWKGSDRKYL